VRIHAWTGSEVEGDDNFLPTERATQPVAVTGQGEA
jgi:hypothetical protein